MSELKATTVYDAYWKANSTVEGTCILVYLKSEADKYINLLKDKANYNEYAYKRKSEELADSCRFYEDELRRQKYERCLAMAKLCHWKMGVFIYKKEKSDFYYRWHKRWIKIAEQFKEGV